MMVTDQPRFLEGYPCFLARIEGRVSLHSVFVCVCVCVVSTNRSTNAPPVGMKLRWTERPLDVRDWKEGNRSLDIDSCSHFPQFMSRERE
jgi:hypothetical protein